MTWTVKSLLKLWLDLPPKGRWLVKEQRALQVLLLVLNSLYASSPKQYNQCRYRKCPQAIFRSVQIFITNFLVLFTKIKVIQTALKLCYSHDWIEQLSYFLTVQVWCLGGFPEACDRGVSRGPLKWLWNSSSRKICNNFFCQDNFF